MGEVVVIPTEDSTDDVAEQIEDLAEKVEDAIEEIGDKVVDAIEDSVEETPPVVITETVPMPVDTHSDCEVCNQGIDGIADAVAEKLSAREADIMPVDDGNNETSSPETDEAPEHRSRLYKPLFQ
jgi:KaiC/GvpD/RAD55 family RecA-like ATPase